MIIRDATIKDAHQLKELLVQLGYILSVEQVSQKVKNYLAREFYYVIVAEKDNLILGFLTMICYESFVEAGWRLRIKSIIVDEKERGKKIGTKLIAAAEKYAKGHNCDLVELITLNRRKKDGTHDFYRSMGFQDHIQTDVTYFSKKIA